MYPSKSLAGVHPIQRSNNFISSSTSTVTSGGTLTLNNMSDQIQYLKGAASHTVVLPVSSSLLLGQTYNIQNGSTQDVTVQSSGLNTISIVNSETSILFTCISITGTGVSSWSFRTLSNSISLGSPGFSTNSTYDSSGSGSLNISAGAIVIFPTLNINIGTAYNTTTGIYTAPATGFFVFSLAVITDNATNVVLSIASNSSSNFTLLTNNAFNNTPFTNGSNTTFTTTIYMELGDVYWWVTTNAISGGVQELRIKSLF